MGRMNELISKGIFIGCAAKDRPPAFRGRAAARVVTSLMVASSVLLARPALSATQKESPSALWSYDNSRPIVDWPLVDLIKKMPDLKGLEPAQNQNGLPAILRKVGANVEAFFRNLISTASSEEIHEERTGINGRGFFNSMKLNYLLLAVPGQNGPGLREYRTDSKGNPAVLRSKSGKFLLTSGFAAVSIYFDPQYQADSRFRFLGKKAVNGHEMLLVAFAQQPDPKDALGGFASSKGSIPVLVQGVAWIDPANFQIMRMRTDLLAPQPNVTLERVTTDISFRQVRFRDSPLVMWLPHEVNVVVTYQYTTFRNEHRYSDYRLFNVDAGTKAAGNPSERNPE